MNTTKNLRTPISCTPPQHDSAYSTFSGVVKSEGGRLDKILCQEGVPLSRTQVQTLIKKGGVTIDGLAAQDPNRILKPGQLFTVHIPDKSLSAGNLTPVNIPLSIVYEDAHILVVDKPAGLTVHPGAGQREGTLVQALLFHSKNNLSTGSGDMRPGIVHRIDKNTSGLLVVAKTDAAHQHLAKQFEAHTIHRVYHGLTRGIPSPEIGLIDQPLGRSRRIRTQMTVKKNLGKRAVTRYRVLEKFRQAAALVACTLETGRTHQIRVHLTFLKHPLLGDPEYGKNYCLPAPLLPLKPLFPRQMLHAKELGFLHPVHQEEFLFTSDYPEDFAEALAALRLFSAA